MTTLKSACCAGSAPHESARNVAAAEPPPSAARRERKEKMENEVVQYTQDQVDAIVLAAVVQATGRLNGYPVHIHKCTQGHPWYCSSPYCEDVNANPGLLCENHGGKPTIQRGMEPWRGGNR